MDAPVRVTYVRRVHQNQQSELPGTSESAGTVRGSMNANGRLSDWMARNLLTQGYCLAAEERTQVRLGFRFATGLCFPLVALASTMLVALAAIGAVAGLTASPPVRPALELRHPARIRRAAASSQPDPAPQRLQDRGHLPARRRRPVRGGSDHGRACARRRVAGGLRDRHGDELLPAAVPALHARPPLVPSTSR